MKRHLQYMLLQVIVTGATYVLFKAAERWATILSLPIAILGITVFGLLFVLDMDDWLARN